MSDSVVPVLDTQLASSPAFPMEPPPLEAAAQPRRLRLEFSATGSEYFRIWIVNLLLTIVTLGIYSAWAKVRKTRYLASNTRLDGVSFQYHGRPGAILRGRLIVGAFAVAYALAGRISIQAAEVASIVVGLLAPWLFFKAMRFKLTNTSWRGVRFGFDSTIGATYAALAPAVVLWVLLSVEIARIRPGQKPALGAFFVVYGLFVAAVPLMHARIKRFQHSATTWGTLRFDFVRSTGAFYALYAKAFLVAIGPMAAMGVAAVTAMTVKVSHADGPANMLPIFIAIYAAMVIAYVIAGAFFYARLQRLIWDRTRSATFRFATTLPARGLMATWLRYGIPTVLTVGLYWPWAAVGIARYQLQHMAIDATGPVDAIAAGATGAETSATGDGAVDYFGWDIGL